MRKKYGEVEKNLMNEMAINLKNVLKYKNITQKELAEMTGLSTSAISDYINAKTLMSLGNVQLISSTLNVKMSDIDPTFRSTSQEEQASRDVVSLPIVGRISCGTGVIVYESIEGYEKVPRDWLNGGEYFFLTAKGDSMTGARIEDGDLLMIRRQDDVEDGDIAAVLIDEEAVLKRVYKRAGALWLQSENPKYPPIVIDGTETCRAQIIGKLKRIVIVA